MEHSPAPHPAEETRRSSSRGRDRNVRRSKSAVIVSVRFHGRRESILAIKQDPNMTSAKVPTPGSEKRQRIGGKKKMIRRSVYAGRITTGKPWKARSRANKKVV